MKIRNTDLPVEHLLTEQFLWQARILWQAGARRHRGHKVILCEPLRLCVSVFSLDCSIYYCFKMKISLTYNSNNNQDE
jgi:hypothetical protein